MRPQSALSSHCARAGSSAAREPAGEHAMVYSAIADMIWTHLESGAGQRPAPRIIVN